MLKTLIGASFAALLTMAGQAGAQSFPNRPMTMVIPFAAGGPTDVLGRVVAARMSELLGQQVVVENVGGAGGMTGSNRVKTAAPDGYTMVLGTVGTHAQNQTLYKKPAYNSATDFTPAGLIAEVPIMLITRKDLPVNNLKEFVDYAKKNQGKMQFGSAGAGSATHLGCVVLNTALGLNITHVPYRGTGPAMQDLQGGRIDYLCEIVSTGKPQVDGGTVKAIAMLTKERSPVLKNVPTAKEQGHDIEAYTWNAIFLPKDTPADVLKKINEAIVGTINTPAVREKLTNLGANVVSSKEATPDYLAKFVKSEIEKWAAPIKASGVTAD
jgi:tripartite-type tricarboxylate transporter receptor subunit TctC